MEKSCDSIHQKLKKENRQMKSRNSSQTFWKLFALMKNANFVELSLLISEEDCGQRYASEDCFKIELKHSTEVQFLLIFC